MSPRKAPPPTEEAIAARAEHRRRPDPVVVETHDESVSEDKCEFKVVGRHAVYGVMPGDSIHLPLAAAAPLLVSGNLEVVEVPVEVLETQTPADVADETGHSPEVTESE